MRKIVFVACWLLAVVAVVGCSGENENENMRKETAGISLVAPDGERIAASMVALNEEVGIIVAKQFGEDYPFHITSVEYTPVEDGYLALISYCLKNGERSSYVKTNSASVLSDTSIDLLRYEISTEQQEWDIAEDKVVLRDGKAPTRGIGSCSDCKLEVTIQ